MKSSKKKLGETPKDPDIILFGGAFDPPHQGHLDCVKVALKRFPDAKILVVPAFKPAGASGNHKTPTMSFAKRVSLCKKLFEEEAAVRVLPLEKDLPRPNFTVNTLRRIRDKFRGKRVALLMGQDQMESFARWHEPLSVLLLADLIVIKRADAKKTLSKVAQALAQELELESLWVRRGTLLMFPRLKRFVFLINKRVSPAASRIIRKRLEGHQSLPRGWLPKDLLNYLAK